MQDFTDQISAIAGDSTKRRAICESTSSRCANLSSRQRRRASTFGTIKRRRKVTSELSAVNEDLELYDRLEGRSTISRRST